MNNKIYFNDLRDTYSFIDRGIEFLKLDNNDLKQYYLTYEDIIIRDSLNDFIIELADKICNKTYSPDFIELQLYFLIDDDDLIENVIRKIKKKKSKDEIYYCLVDFFEKNFIDNIVDDLKGGINDGNF